MVKKLLCVSSELNGFTNGKLYNIVPNEANPSFEKWVYNDNGQYVYIHNSLMGLYFKLVKTDAFLLKASMKQDAVNCLKEKLDEIK